ncbi:MAG TPA: hypothetical protein VGD22_12565 [Sphingobacteriaceae bacterium]
MSKKIFSLLLFSFCFLSCSKDKVNKNRELSPLGKKLIGKWMLQSFNPAPNDFWEFKDEIIESISNDTITYRAYTDSVAQSLCKRAGTWYEKDSILYGSCVPVSRILKLTADTLIFRHTSGLTYIWKKAK